MGISFGSTGIKPYVGSKEVTEAYVGSQLVYRAVPPYKYYFLGAENDYIIDNSVISLSDKRATIAKDGGIYRIVLTAESYGNPGHVRVNLTNTTFTFIARVQSGIVNPSISINMYKGNTYSEASSYRVNCPSSYTLFTVNIPPYIDNVRIAHNSGTSSTTYVDAIKSDLK